MKKEVMEMKKIVGRNFSAEGTIYVKKEIKKEKGKKKRNDDCLLNLAVRKGQAIPDNHVECPRISKPSLNMIVLASDLEFRS